MMGLYDRQYYREENEARGGVQGPRTVVGTIILINVIVFVIDAFWTKGPAMHPLQEWLSLPADLFSRPWEAWKLVSYGFLHAPMDDPSGRGIWHILMNMYGLWLFGRDVESTYGAKEFLRVYLTMVVVSGLAWVLVQGGANARLLGASGAVSGTMVLYVLHFPHRKFLMIPIPFQIPAWGLCIFIIGMDVMGAVGYRDASVAYVAHLAGAASAFLYYRSGIRLTQFSPSFKFRSPFSSRPKLKVHDPKSRQAKLERQADEILQKVHDHGADSITAAERKILDDYSRHMRQKHS